MKNYNSDSSNYNKMTNPIVSHDRTYQPDNFGSKTDITPKGAGIEFLAIKKELK